MEPIDFTDYFIYKVLRKGDLGEEPVPFDWYEETKEVTDALMIPIAGGKQEPSRNMFCWLMENDILVIVQPDMFYLGAMVKLMEVARIHFKYQGMISNTN